MIKVKRLICAILCAVLCIAGCNTDQTAGGKKSAVSSVQMTEFNKDLTPAVRDDKYRTTYEIFVYSFCDSDGDGIGDINGIRSKLDYIADMGFDALWLTPVHPSSTYHKYDVDDYYAVDPAFGTMEDYEALLAECHERGIKVYLDLVLNHTSDTHEWFKQAVEYLKQLPEGWDIDPSYCKYADYYVFQREGSQGFAPLEGTGWYYEAQFWSEMPDLNLASEDVRNEIRDIVSFWLGKGVDGFRLDAVLYYVKDNAAANVEFLSWFKDTCRAIDPDCYLVGEAWTDRAHIAELYPSGIDSLFEFPFAGKDGNISRIITGDLKASDFVVAMLKAEEAYSAENPDYVGAPFYTNHDMARSAGYYPADEGPMTKMAYAMSLLMRGNSFVYYGEEIGMKGAGIDENKRAPMYWSDDAKAEGMCSGPPNMEEVTMKFPSLEDQMKDASSIWNWFKETVKVRRAFPAIARGMTSEAKGINDASVAAFYRTAEGEETVLIVMNLRADAAEKDLSGISGGPELAAVLNTDANKVANLRCGCFSAMRKRLCPSMITSPHTMMGLMITPSAKMFSSS